MWILDHESLSSIGGGGGGGSMDESRLPILLLTGQNAPGLNDDSDPIVCSSPSTPLYGRVYN